MRCDGTNTTPPRYEHSGHVHSCTCPPCTGVQRGDIAAPIPELRPGDEASISYVELAYNILWTIHVAGYCLSATQDR